MGILNHVKTGSIEVWDDLYNVRLDDKTAPDLGDAVRGVGESMYADPREFFSRTYLTESMENLIKDIAETLKDGKGGAVYLLTSLFGGGKTHTLITLYHAFRSPEALKEVNAELAEKIAEVEPIIIVMDGSRSDLTPHPKEPYKVGEFTIKTIWGMLAYKLGVYNKIKDLDSEKASVPSVNTLQNMLAEVRKPILILLDEIVHYVFNMMNSSDLKEYGNEVKLFLGYLARAVENTPKAVLVVSIQAEYRRVEGREELLEENMFRGYARDVLKSLTRESTKIVTPVSPDDIAKVLQRRIFKKISEEEARKAGEELYRKYREHPELFGRELDWWYSTETGRTLRVEDTYPFHPKYLEVLQEFVTRNKDLQKTRDAIRITRKVVRRFLQSNKDSSFIMPWHIDLKDDDIRVMVLTQSYSEFRDIVSKDIVSSEGRLGSISKCSKRELAYRIATAVFLKTYTYETFKEPLKVFPDATEVALMVYDPETFTAENLTSPDIKDTLDEMVNRLLHLTSENNRYWFTPYPSVIEYVEKRAEEMLREPRLELYRVLTERVKNILTKREKRGVEEVGEVFEEKNVKVVGYEEEITVDDKPYLQLVVLVKPEVSEDEVRNIILMRGKEGRRTYRNAVVVVCPHQQVDFNILLSLAARIKSAEEVLNNLAEYYKDKDIRSLQERKLKAYIDDKVKLLNERLLSALTRIAYPVKEAGRDEVGWITTTAASAVIPQVEAGLENPATGPKLRTDISFEDLVEFLKSNQNWDLIEGTRAYTFRDILNTFYTVTSAPLTTRYAIEQAIKSGVEALDIGVMMDGKLYWKQVGPQGDAEIPTKIKDDAEILPYRKAASILKDILQAESGIKKVDRKIYEVCYDVEINNRRIKLKDLIHQKDWEKILKAGTIIRNERVITSGFILTLQPSSLTIKAGERVKVKALIRSTDSYNLPIKIEVDRGTITPSEGKAPFEVMWDLGIIEEVGDYEFEIKAIGEDGTKFTSTLTVRVESLEEEIETERLDSTHTGTQLIQVTPKNLVALQMAVETLSKLNQEAIVSQLLITFDGIITISSKEIDSKLAGYLAQKLREIEMTLRVKETRFEGVLKLKQPMTLDESKITAFTPLSEKVIFKLRVMNK